MYDVAIVGGGMAGMATAARLQARGLSTVVLEAHNLPGGCAGFYRRDGFTFDVGATTLVDFEERGVGGQFLAEVGIESFDAELLPGYVAWLPDRKIVLHRDTLSWRRERLAMLGDSPRHRTFWQTIDVLAAVLWRAARHGARMPIRGPIDTLRALGAVGLRHVHLARYLRWTLGDLLRASGLRDDRPLLALLSMLVEDTVHATIDEAPLVNAALGVTIRGAGLTRARGGMRGFWMTLLARYRQLGGELKTRSAVEVIEKQGSQFKLITTTGAWDSKIVVCAVPASLTARIAPRPVSDWLAHYVRRDSNAMGGAIVLCLGVPEDQVAAQAFTHHQLLHDFDRPLGNGNNMFISVSAPGDRLSAPAGWRSVMISTHCDLTSWRHRSPEDYAHQKQAAGQRLVALARRVYPNLARPARVLEVATPLTYERFTGRPGGAVGGVHQTLLNTNQYAIPHQSPLAGFWMAGDSTWPGLGTVACLIGSRIVADGVLAHARRARAMQRIGLLVRGKTARCISQPSSMPEPLIDAR